MRVPNIHAVVLRKVGNTLATSVWPEYNRVIDRMGIRHLWKQTKKPYTPVSYTHLFWSTAKRRLQWQHCCGSTASRGRHSRTTWRPA